MTTSTQPAHIPPEGYEDVSIPLTKIVREATILGIVMLVVPLLIYILIHGWGAFWATALGYDWLTALIAIVALIVIHELIHAVGWKVFGKLRWQDLTFGIDRKTLSPYCHAKVPMRADAYRIGAALPGILTGVVPAIIGIAQANAPLTLLAAFMISAAVGDLLVLWVIRDVPGDALVKDHPSNAGCYVKRT
jgi:hypothetical protein